MRGAAAGLWLACVALGAAVAGAQAPECVVIDDFARAKVGAFPSDWKPRKDSGLSVYTVLEDKGFRFLRAEAKGDRKSTRLNSSHIQKSRMPSSA